MKKVEEYILPCLRCGEEFDALKVVHRCNRNKSWHYDDRPWADPIPDPIRDDYRPHFPYLPYLPAYYDE